MRTSPLDGFRPGARNAAEGGGAGAPTVHGAPSVGGTARVPRSKSIAQRALVCARLASGTTRLEQLPDAEDVRHVAAALGVPLAGAAGAAAGTVAVPGRAPGRAALPDGEPGGGPYTADVGESGTGARLVTAALALCARPGSAVRVTGSGSLARRASPALFAALARAGVGVDHQGTAGGWPVLLTPTGPPSELLLTDPTSSQEVSALLIALAAYPGTGYLRVHGAVPSAPYVALTRAVLARFDVQVLDEAPPAAGVPGAPDASQATYVVRGPLTAPAQPFVVEPDASAAAVALAAGCLGGGEVRVPGLGAGSAQGDVRIAEHLARFGCRAEARADELVASGAPTRGAELDLSGEPDLAPVLAAVAAVCALRGGGASLLTGLGTLPGKESSRIEVLARGLRAIGLAAEAGTDRLALARGEPSDVPVVLDPAGDHRMAFAFGLLGLAREGIRVADPGCVAKSWPSFWDDLEALGARRAAT